MYILAIIAGKSIVYQYTCADVPMKFGKYLSGTFQTEEEAKSYSSNIISIQQKDYETAFPERNWNKMNAEEEFSLLGEKTSDYLMLRYNIFMFHGVAFSFNGRGYIFTAPSGTGKSTQYFYWKLLYNDQVQIINGDKPFLEFQPDGKIMIFPGPWCGKEHMGQEITCLLKGIVYLEQSDHDEMTKFDMPDSIIPVACQICHSRSTIEIIQKAAELESILLTSIPLYKLKNRGLKDSARLCHSILIGEDDHV